ncbi:MAG: hypothetical protein LBT78_06065 [Tannerella sp.]|jgi:hypothetical protein|nr:hypothetical protein [Tannerella sp.]
MNRRNIGIGIVVACCLSLGSLSGQHTDDYRKQFDRFQQQTESRFDTFRDSTNRVYAEYLSRSWEQFGIQAPKPVPKKPLPVEDTQYIPGEDSVPAVLPIDTVTIPAHQEVETHPVPEAPERTSAPSLRLQYFGTSVEMSRFDGFQISLPAVDEHQVSACWLQLSQQPYRPFIREIVSLKETLNLNDWALYRLLIQVSDAYFPPTQTNAKTVFTVFMLNQIGYRVKIGRQGGRLLPLIAFRTEVYGKRYISLPDGNYYVFGSDNASVSQVFSYRLNYGSAMAGISLAVTKPFRLDMAPGASELRFEGKVYTIAYNRNLIDLYKTFPQTELTVYANTPLSSATRRSLEKELLPSLKDKEEDEALTFLLTFVQKAFPYKTDQAQFGYEKYFFVEELFHYPYSDCEDRAVLFAQLVRRFIGLEVVLLDYPDHVATAVKQKKRVEGDYINVNNERYIVCDPTYIGAPVGKAMTRCKEEKARVLALN